MKITKNLILIFILLAVLLMPSNANAATHYTIEIRCDVPVEGQAPDLTATAKYLLNEVETEVTWFESTDKMNWKEMTTTIFEVGKYYAPSVNLTMEQIYNELLKNKDVTGGYTVGYRLNYKDYMLETYDTVYYPVGIYGIHCAGENYIYEGAEECSVLEEYYAKVIALPGYQLPEEIEIEVGGSSEDIRVNYDSKTGEIYIREGELTSDIGIIIEPIEKERYFIEAANQEWAKDSENTLKFTLDEDYTRAFGGAYVDYVMIDDTKVKINELREKGTDNEGNEIYRTVLEIPLDVLKSLNIGTHKIEAIFDNGKGPLAEFIVKEAVNIETGVEGGKTPSNPDTGDEIIFTLIMLGICLLGIGVTTKLGKNK